MLGKIITLDDFRKQKGVSKYKYAVPATCSIRSSMPTAITKCRVLILMF